MTGRPRCGTTPRDYLRVDRAAHQLRRCNIPPPETTWSNRIHGATLPALGHVRSDRQNERWLAGAGGDNREWSRGWQPLRCRPQPGFRVIPRSGPSPQTSPAIHPAGGVGLNLAMPRWSPLGGDGRRKTPQNRLFGGQSHPSLGFTGPLRNLRLGRACQRASNRQILLFP